MFSKRLAAFLAHRQGLLEPINGSPSELLRAQGWARSVGGTNPYLSLYARGGLDRAAVERAVLSSEIHELPSARGCTYVLPSGHFELGLTLSQEFVSDLATARKLGVTDAELTALSESIVECLVTGAKKPAALKSELGDKVRNLGEEGKKKGLTTTLPVCLGLLQSQGRIRRVAADCRLDQQSFAYTLWEPRLAVDPPGADALEKLAKLYWSWTGLASIAHFSWFSGKSQTQCRAAVQNLGLSEGLGQLLGTSDTWQEFERFAEPQKSSYRWLSSLDGHFLLRRDLSFLIQPEHLSKVAALSEKATAGGGISELPAQALVDRGQVIGLWEYDSEQKEIVLFTFDPLTAEILQAKSEFEKWTASNFDDLRSFSLDSPASRKPLLEKLRRAQSSG